MGHRGKTGLGGVAVLCAAALSCGGGIIGSSSSDGGTDSSAGGDGSSSGGSSGSSGSSGSGSGGSTSSSGSRYDSGSDASAPDGNPDATTDATNAEAANEDAGDAADSSPTDAWCVDGAVDTCGNCHYENNCGSGFPPDWPRCMPYVGPGVGPEGGFDCTQVCGPAPTISMDGSTTWASCSIFTPDGGSPTLQCVPWQCW
jgi:hypothetical protein